MSVTRREKEENSWNLGFDIEEIYFLPYSQLVAVLDRSRNKLAFYDLEERVCIASTTFPKGLSNIVELSDKRVICSFIDTCQIYSINYETKQLQQISEIFDFEAIAMMGNRFCFGISTDEKDNSSLNIYDANSTLDYVKTYKTLFDEDQIAFIGVVETSSGKLVLAFDNDLTGVLEAKEDKVIDYPLSGIDAHENLIQTIHLAALTQDKILSCVQRDAIKTLKIHDLKDNTFYEADAKNVPDKLKKWVASPSGTKLYSFVENTDELFVLDVATLSHNTIKFKSKFDNLIMTTEGLVLLAAGHEILFHETEEYKKYKDKWAVEISPMFPRVLTEMIMEMTFFGKYKMKKDVPLLLECKPTKAP